MKRILGLLTAAAIIGIPMFAKADVPTVSYKSTYTSSGTRTGPVIALAGQNTCTVTTSGGSSGYTVTVKGSSVGSGTLTTLTQFGTSGAITTDSSNVGALVGTQVALTTFAYVVTRTITGTLTVVETCSSASAGATVTGTVNVSVSNFPSPGPTSSPGNAPLVVLANASAVPYSATTPVPVTTPAPCATGAHGGCVVEGVASGVAVPISGAPTPIPWTTASPAPTKICDGTRCITLDSASNLNVALCGTAQATCAQAWALTQALGPTNAGITTISQIYAQNSAGSSVTPLFFSPLATGLLATGADSTGATAPIICDKQVAVNISTATTTELVAASGTKKVYVCAYDLYVVSGTTPSFQFEYGTKVTTACDTGPTVMTGTYGGIAAAVGQSFGRGGGLGSILRTTASQSLCIVTGGTSPNVQGFVSYAQL